jgi:hypothetical protein
MSKQLNVLIIEQARTLIADETHWCRHQMGFDSDGRAVPATDKRASKLCAYGALIAAAHQMTNDCGRAYDLASRTVSYFGGSSSLIEVNDTQGHAAILKLFNEVIAQVA